VAMLLFLRENIVGSDYTTTMQHLMKFPHTDPYPLLRNAIILRLEHGKDLESPVSYSNGASPDKVLSPISDLIEFGSKYFGSNEKKKSKLLGDFKLFGGVPEQKEKKVGETPVKESEEKKLKDKQIFLLSSLKSLIENPPKCFDPIYDMNYDDKKELSLWFVALKDLIKNESKNLDVQIVDQYLKVPKMRRNLSISSTAESSDEKLHSKKNLSITEVINSVESFDIKTKNRKRNNNLDALFN
jgi:hypothetical protein